MRYQHCVLLPFALVLMVAGLMALLFFGLGNLEPYHHTKHFRVASCTVIYSNVTGSLNCRHKDKEDLEKIVHQSIYPCLEIFVNYTEDDQPLWGSEKPAPEEEVSLDVEGNNTDSEGRNRSVRVQNVRSNSNRKQEEEDLEQQEAVILYDAYDSWTKEHNGAANATCSIHVCKEDRDDNWKHVNKFMKNYGELGDTFTCYFNPGNPKEVYSEIVTGNSVMHALVWPALAMGFGVFLLVVVAFLSCEVWICRNPKRAQRRMRGQTYELAMYRESLRDPHGKYREETNENRNNQRNPGSRKPGDGNNNSRLPKLSAAADIVRKWSLRSRTDTSSRKSDGNGTNKSSQSYAGKNSKRLSHKRDPDFSTA